MPKFIILNDRPEGLSSVKVELRICTEGDVAVLMHHKGMCNTIGHFTEDGKLQLPILNPGWAERAGIQVDSDGKIQIQTF